MLPPYSPPISEWAQQVESLINGYGYNLRDADTEAAIRCFLLPKIPNEYMHLLPDPPDVGRVLTALKAIGVRSSGPYTVLQNNFTIDQKPSMTFAQIKKAIRETMDAATPIAAISAFAWSRLIQLLPKEVAMSDAVTAVQHFPDENALRKLDRTYEMAQAYQAGRNADRYNDQHARFIGAIATSSATNQDTRMVSADVPDPILRLVQQQQRDIEALTKQLTAMNARLESQPHPTQQATACAFQEPTTSGTQAQFTQVSGQSFSRPNSYTNGPQRPRFNNSNRAPMRQQVPRFQYANSYGQPQHSTPPHQRGWMCPAHYSYGPAAYSCQPRCILYADFVRASLLSTSQSLSSSAYQLQPFNPILQQQPSHFQQPYTILPRPPGRGPFQDNREN